MGLLEDGLRSAFAAQVAAPPVIEDLAGTAIRRARRVRRQRTALGALAAILAVAAVGVVALPGGPEFAGPAKGPGLEPSTATTAPLAVTYPVDVLYGDRILRADGRVVSLAATGRPQMAYQVQGGWLVTANDPARTSSTVWFVESTGAPHQLAEGEAVMVSAGSAARPGPQVAWAAGTLSLATFAAGTLTGVVTTPSPGLSAMRVVGGALVLAGTKTGGGLDTWDDWFPVRGDYKPTTTPMLTQVIGANAENSQLFALYINEAGTKNVCLGLLNPDGFVPVRSTCTLTVGLDDRIYPSRDGRLWAITTQTRVTFYDAENAWGANPQPVATLPYRAVNVVWQGEQAILTSGTQVIRVRVGTGSTETFDLPRTEVTGGTVAVIPDLRS